MTKLILLALGIYISIYFFLHLSRCFGTCARQSSNARACSANQVAIQKQIVNELALNLQLNENNHTEFFKRISLKPDNFMDPGFREVGIYRSDYHGNVWCINHGKGWTDTLTCVGDKRNECNQTRSDILSWYSNRFTLYKSALIYLRDKMDLDYIGDSRKL